MNKEFPLNREEINQFLKEAESIFSGCLTGIETINLGERPPHYPMTVIGSYKKFGPFKSKNRSDDSFIPYGKRRRSLQSLFYYGNHTKLEMFGKAKWI